MTVLPAALDLTGRTAVVTGAGSPAGIGAATASLLGACGARVVVTATTDRVQTRAAELVAAGVDAVGVTADLTTAAGAEVVVTAALAHGGGLDVLVANAGMVVVGDADRLEGDLLSTTPERWSASLARNLDTAYHSVRAALPALRDCGGGRVVLVSSVTGAVMAMRDEVGYASAKAGLVGLARALAVDEAAHGVTVNVVAPGWIATGSQTTAEVGEGELTPLGRSGSAAEVASAVVWLASPGASYVTGQVVVVDGGNSIAEERAPGRRR